ncbi:hypothetical protein KO481_01880 [Nocardia sp. NEAU-G5]|uniref:Secreted protein n=1 Tax=Nocardia albiluteola TaxID=2842303 RepID=A0ABS6AQI4_9NOCA|nr:hypothetical protein [Nocardia albiluteola]MBU3060274.1 hypothetical protein [Nocardia albiluteola]
MQLKRTYANKLVAALAVGTAILAGTALSGAGTANAAEYWGGPVDIHCSGLSPNIVDFPYTSTIYWSGGSARPGVASFTVNPGISVWGYGTHPTLTWTNLATRASGTVTGYGRVSLGDPTGVYFANIATGPGPVRLDLSVVNTGPAPLPPAICSGTINIR